MKKDLKAKRRNETATKKFLTHLNEHHGSNWRESGVAFFPANVIYEFGGQSRFVATSVFIYLPGNIQLMDASWLNADDHYIEFNSEWQDFSVTSSNSLMIEGTGQKIGRYKVTIEHT